MFHVLLISFIFLLLYAPDHTLTHCEFALSKVLAERSVNNNSNMLIGVWYTCLPCKMSFKEISDFVKHRHGNCCSFKSEFNFQAHDLKGMCLKCGIVMPFNALGQHAKFFDKYDQKKKFSSLSSAITKKSSRNQSIKKLDQHQVASLLQDTIKGIDALHLPANN